MFIQCRYKRGEDRQLYPYNVTVDRSLKACCDGYIGKRCTDCIDPSICGGSTTTESVTEPPTVSKPCYVQKNFSIFYTKLVLIIQVGRILAVHPFTMPSVEGMPWLHNLYGYYATMHNGCIILSMEIMQQNGQCWHGKKDACCKHFINYSNWQFRYKRRENGELIPYNVTEFRSTKDCCDGYGGERCRECLDPEICGENRPVTTEEPEVTEKSNVTEGPPPTCSKLINFNITYTE